MCNHRTVAYLNINFLENIYLLRNARIEVRKHRPSFKHHCDDVRKYASVLVVGRLRNWLGRSRANTSLQAAGGWKSKLCALFENVALPPQAGILRSSLHVDLVEVGCILAGLLAHLAAVFRLAHYFLPHWSDVLSGDRYDGDRMVYQCIVSIGIPFFVNFI